MNKTQTHGYKLASKGKRLLATIVESIIIAIFVYILQSLNHAGSIGLLENGLKGELVYYGFISVVIGSFYPQYIGNIGHAIFGLKVISSENGEDYKTSFKGIIRELLKYVLSFLIIPAIWILWDEKNQNLYDKITNTLVVEKNEKIKNTVESKSDKIESDSNKYEELSKLKKLLDNETLTKEEYQTEKKKILDKND
ncbi:MAG: RDD family protein [Bacteroidetes bacterium]|nr:MAG: RDD family protein [Bacteroidota bacterium]MBL1146056.1 RDD family protein [Bacteroidota bacterium]NOG58849.1 RDD family protein [Bacteroidota bacterium]